MTRPVNPIRRRALPRPRRSDGLGLVTAIFLLVVLSGMAVAMVTLTTTQHTSAALDIQGVRAYQAARAGIEYGLFQGLSAAKPCDAAATQASFALPAGTSLSGFSVTVICVPTAVPGAAPVHQLTAIACNQPSAAGVCPNPSNSPDYVQRKLNAQF